MLCDECHKEPATVHVTRIMNDQKTEFHLCSECARARGEASQTVEPGFAFHNILAGLFEQEGSAMAQAAARSTHRCSNCGLTLSDFRRLGQLGCSHCYAQFQAELEPLLRRVHRSVEHVGKQLSGRSSERNILREIHRLRKRLKEAVAREAYEEAARLRDEIKQLEQEASQPLGGGREGE